MRKININDNLMTLFQVLADNHILACVVVDDLGHYRGFVYALDLVNFIVDFIDMRTFGPLTASTKQRLMETTVGFLATRPTKREVHLGYSLYHCFEQMAFNSQQYLALVDAFNRPIGVLSQSMIIRWLHNKIDYFGSEVRNCPIWQIRNYTNVVSVRETQTDWRPFD